MKPMHLLAALLFAAGGLALSVPAEAAPKSGPGVSAQPGGLFLVDHRDGDREWRRRRDRDDDDWRRGRRGDDDDWRRHRDRDDRGWRRHGWRGDHDRDRRHRHGRWSHDRGKHKGWWRGRGHDRHWRPGRGHGHDGHWDRKDRKEWAKERRKWAKERRKWIRERRREWAKERRKWIRERRRWRARQHPRHREWIGRPFRYDGYSMLRDYDDYYLPRPQGGSFYARNGSNVFLVDEATRIILDAFLLSDAFRR